MTTKQVESFHKPTDLIQTRQKHRELSTYKRAEIWRSPSWYHYMLEKTMQHLSFHVQRGQN